jgi:hypothetical protein
LRDRLDVPMRVGRARALEPRRRTIAKAEIGGIEVGVLPGDDQRRAAIEGGEGAGDRRELDRFGPRADDQPDIRGTQISS